MKKPKQQIEGENLFIAIVKAIFSGLVRIRSATLSEELSDRKKARLTIFLEKKSNDK